MTVHELFEELRKEPDWSKEVVVFIGSNLKPVSSVIPNLINDSQLLLSVKEDKE